MAATIIIERHTGAASGPGGSTQDDITSTNTRCTAQDGHHVSGIENPIERPTSGSNYSYWVSTRLECTVAPTTRVDNLKWYTDGADSFGTGITCKVRDASNGPNQGYYEATGTEGVTGTELTQANHAGLNGATEPEDVFNYTSSSPLSLLGFCTGTTTGGFGFYIVYQFAVDSTADAGPSSQETFTWQYDEW